MLMFRKNQSNAETRPSATPSTEYLRWAGSGSKPGLPRDRLATERLNHGTACSLLSSAGDITQNTQ